MKSHPLRHARGTSEGHCFRRSIIKEIPLEGNMYPGHYFRGSISQGHYFAGCHEHCKPGYAQECHHEHCSFGGKFVLDSLKISFLILLS